MRMQKVNPTPFLALLLAACGPATVPDQAATSAKGAGSGPSTEELCVSSDCGEAVKLVAIPDAENILFGPGGRLFVSGGLNVSEITKAGDGTFSAQPLSAQTCGFTGLAIHRNHLYATCGDSRLFAGRLDGELALTEIYRFIGMCIPNGTAVGPDGRLYVVDEPLNCQQADPKIVALTLDQADPTKVLAQESWIQACCGSDRTTCCASRTAWCWTATRSTAPMAAACSR